jgi:hypothetical protein
LYHQTVTIIPGVSKTPRNTVTIAASATTGSIHPAGTLTGLALLLYQNLSSGGNALLLGLQEAWNQHYASAATSSATDGEAATHCPPPAGLKAKQLVHR